ncbi:MAG: ribosome biogenesis GTP-binding protein YihA/YsxC [Bdellovibrionales bacterium]
MNVRFMKSGWREDEYPPPALPEVALVGRSNAGKSSFLNALTGQRTAKVSQTPGKTRLLNFFSWGERLSLVDMPGYGFATGNRSEVQAWKKMIETYLTTRETLRGVVLIMDIRRPWSDEEEMLQQWFASNEITWALVLNKADKLSRSQMLKKRGEIEREVGQTPIFVVSSLKKNGLDQVKNLIIKEWAK